MVCVATAPAEHRKSGANDPMALGHFTQSCPNRAPSTSGRPAKAGFGVVSKGRHAACGSASMSSRPHHLEAPADDDAALVARCRSGDAGAWKALVERYQRLVYAIVRRIGLDNHAAADVFQTVFSRLIEHLPRIEDPTRLQAWIVTCAKREALRQRQLGLRTVSMSREDEGSDDGAPDWEPPDPSPVAEEALEHLQQVNGVRIGLERLDERCRSLLMLVFRDEDETLSYQDVAARLGVPVGSLGPTRARCLDKLRRLVT